MLAQLAFYFHALLTHFIPLYLGIRVRVVRVFNDREKRRVVKIWRDFILPLTLLPVLLLLSMLLLLLLPLPLLSLLSWYCNIPEIRKYLGKSLLKISFLAANAAATMPTSCSNSSCPASCCPSSCSPSCYSYYPSPTSFSCCPNNAAGQAPSYIREMLPLVGDGR